MADTRVRDMTEATALVSGDQLYAILSGGGDRRHQVQNAPYPFRIANTTLAATATSIAFSSIPATWKHLRLVGILRTDRAVSGESVYVSVNSDTTDANYDCQFSTQINTTTSAAEVLAAAGSRFVLTANGSSATANQFTSFDMFIQDYAGAQRKNILCLYQRASARTTGTLTLGRAYVHWANTAAITSVSFAPVTGPNFIVGCTVSLWGYG